MTESIARLLLLRAALHRQYCCWRRKKRVWWEGMDMVWLCCLFALLSMAHGGNVTYDGRSLIINGEHKILFSGEIHYPRSTPQVIYCFFHYYSHQIKAQQIFEIWKVFLMFSITLPFFGYIFLRHMIAIMAQVTELKYSFFFCVCENILTQKLWPKWQNTPFVETFQQNTSSLKLFRDVPLF